MARIGSMVNNRITTMVKDRISSSKAIYVEKIVAAFTSLTSSTSASYSAVVTGTPGQTLTLFLNGVSQGSMTESPAGTYTKSITLNQLSNALQIKVGATVLASQTVYADTLYWDTNPLTWGSEFIQWSDLL